MEAVVILTWLGMFLASITHHSPASTVVLLDNNKTHNAIIVKTDAGSTIIDKPGEYVTLVSKKEPPSKKKTMDKAIIEKKFKSVITALPPTPVHVLLYFENNSNKLTEASLNKLPQILKYIQKRSPCDINIIGHTDTKGSQKYNVKLAMKRAQMIKKWIASQGVKTNNIKVQSYGEADPLVKTGDNVSEPLNRRVELLIK